MGDDDDDDDKYDLFAYARSTDPETSHAAARAASPETQRNELLVMHAIAGRRHTGANWREVTDILDGIISRQAISPRWKPLRKKDYITWRFHDAEETEMIKRPGWTARLQIVWFLTPAGEAYLKLHPWHEVIESRPIT